MFLMLSYNRMELRPFTACNNLVLPPAKDNQISY